MVIILLSAMTSGEAAASGEAMAMSQMVKSVTWSSSSPSRRIVGIVLMAFPAKMIFDYNSIGGQTNIKKKVSNSSVRQKSIEANLPSGGSFGGRGNVVAGKNLLDSPSKLASMVEVGGAGEVP